MTQPRYTDEDYERSFNGFLASIESILKQCDELRGTVRNATELIADCRENLSEALKGISLTGDFAQVSCGAGVIKTLVDSAGEGAEEVRLSRPEQPTMLPSAPKVDEAERKHYANQHRLEQEYAERYPEEK